MKMHMSLSNSSALGLRFVAGLVAMALLLGGSQSTWAQQADPETAKQYGEVQSVSGNSLTVRTVSGEHKTFNLTQDATVLLNGRRVDLNGLQPGDEVSISFDKANPQNAMSLRAFRDVSGQAASRQERREARRPVGADRPALGVVIQDTEDKNGVEVLSVRPGSAADKAGIRAGDRITKIKDQSIDTPSKFSDLIRQEKPGSSLDLTILREGKEQSLKAVLGSRGEVFGRLEDLREGMQERREARRERLFGDRGEDLQEAEKQSWLGLFLEKAEDEDGVEVMNVFPGGPGDKAGLKRGDIIKGINDDAISSPSDVIDLVDDLKPGDTAKIKISRDDGEHTLDVTLGSRAQFLREHPQQFREQFRFGPEDQPMQGDGFGAMMMERAREESERRDRMEKLGQQLLNEIQGLRNDVKQLHDSLPKAQK